MSRKPNSGRPTLRVVGSDDADPLFADYGPIAGPPKRSAEQPDVVAAKTTSAFAQVPLRWAAKAAKATNEPAALVVAYLFYRAWKAKGPAFPLPSKWLEQHGVSRRVKRRVLRDLEGAGLITTKKSNHQSPIVTLVTP
jgi:hypothetical protein